MLENFHIAQTLFSTPKCAAQTTKFKLDLKDTKEEHEERRRRRRRRRLGCWWWWGPPSWPEVVSNSTPHKLDGRQAGLLIIRWQQEPIIILRSGLLSLLYRCLSHSKWSIPPVMDKVSYSVYHLFVMLSVINLTLMKYYCLLFDKQRNDIIICLKLLVTVLKWNAKGVTLKFHVDTQSLKFQLERCWTWGERDFKPIVLLAGISTPSAGLQVTKLGRFWQDPNLRLWCKMGKKQEFAIWDLGGVDQDWLWGDRRGGWMCWRTRGGSGNAASEVRPSLQHFENNRIANYLETLQNNLFTW